MPVPVAARSKAYTCGRTLVGIAGSNPAVAWMSLVTVLCYQQRSLQRADQSSRGVLPTVVHRCVRCVVCDLEASRIRWPRPPSGPQRHRKKKIINIIFILYLPLFLLTRPS